MHDKVSSTPSRTIAAACASRTLSSFSATRPAFHANGNQRTSGSPSSLENLREFHRQYCRKPCRCHGDVAVRYVVNTSLDFAQCDKAERIGGAKLPAGCVVSQRGAIRAQVDGGDGLSGGIARITLAKSARPTDTARSSKPST